MGDDAAAKGRETLAALRTRADIAAFLEVDPRLLRYVLYKLTAQERYREFAIRKRNGETRVIRAPIARLKDWQRRVATLGSQYKAPRCVFGYIDGRNIQQKRVVS